MSFFFHTFVILKLNTKEQNKFLSGKGSEPFRFFHFVPITILFPLICILTPATSSIIHTIREKSS